MAEIFGTVASAAALAELCIKSVFKMKKLWDELKGVSEEIDRLVEDIQQLQPFLQRVEATINRQQHVASEPSSQSVVQAYGNVARGLESLARNLQQQISSAKKGKRTLAKLKSTFEKDLIQNYRARLQTLSYPLFLCLSMDNLDIQTDSLGLQKQSLSLHTQPSSRLDYLVALVESQIIRSTRRAPLEASSKEPDHEKDRKTSASFEKGSTPGVDRRQGGRQSIAWRPASVIGSFTYQTFSNSDLQNSSARQVRLQLPGWVSGKAWDFYVRKAYDGWKIQLKPWTTRPEYDPIFQLVEEASWPVIFQYISQGHASILDRDECGETLLFHAIERNRFDVASRLIEMGLSVAEATIFDRRALNFDIVIWDVKDPVPNNCREGWMETFALMLASGDCEEFFLDAFDSSRTGFSALSYFLWCIPGLFSLITTELADHSQLSTKDCFASLCWETVYPRIFLEELLRSKTVQPQDFRANAMVRRGFSSLPDFTRIYFSLFPPDIRKELQTLDRIEEAMGYYHFTDWRELSRWIFKGISLDELCAEYQYPTILEAHSLNPAFTMTWTSLLAAFDSFTLAGPSIYDREYLFGLRLTRRAFYRKMICWLEDVKSSGIDLKNYGRRELELYQANHQLKSRRWPYFGAARQWERHLGPRLSTFVFGPSPEDWKLVWDLDAEEFAGDFWETVENPPQRIPGAWVEDDGEDVDGWGHIYIDGRIMSLYKLQVQE